MKNLCSSAAAKLVVLVLNFVLRTAFIAALGNDYLSINGLFGSILSTLSLAELGFGTAMVYHLYRPLAQRDEDALRGLLQMYRRAYRVIGAVVLVLGVAVLPLLPALVRELPELPHLRWYYGLYLANSVASYWLWAHQCAVLTADQKEYIRTNIRTAVSVGKALAQLAALWWLGSFTAYLLVQLAATIAENALTARRARQLYPAVGHAADCPVPAEERRRIWRDVASLAATRLGHVALHSTDSIVIAAVVGVSWVGLLSNYRLICETVTGILCLVTGALTAGLGNYFAQKSPQEGRLLFRRLEFLNFWLYGLSAVALLVLLDPFVMLWLGEDYRMSGEIVWALVINFAAQGYLHVLWTFRSAMGLFRQGWYRSVLVAVVNLLLSVLLGRIWGVFGVLIATFLANALVRLWFEPLIIHKYGLRCPVGRHLAECIWRVVQLGIMALPLLAIRQWLLAGGVTAVRFVVLALICAAEEAAVFALLNGRRDEVGYGIDAARGFISRRG